MAEMFTGFRVFSMDQSSKVYGPPQPLSGVEEKGWEPYIDMGYHGGSYWARPGADPKNDDLVFQTLYCFGFERVENSLGFRLRELMKREPTEWFTHGDYKIPIWDLKDHQDLFVE